MGDARAHGEGFIRSCAHHLTGELADLVEGERPGARDGEFRDPERARRARSDRAGVRAVGHGNDDATGETARLKLREIGARTNDVAYERMFERRAIAAFEADLVIVDD